MHTQNLLEKELANVLSDSYNASELPGMFITFEGGDSCGKTTQVHALSEWLTAQGYEVLVTREPGETPVGEGIRDLLLNPRYTVDERTEALLYAADRAQHVRYVILPALAEGKIVLCDRYIDSSVAYQGVGRNLGENTIRLLSQWATRNLQPSVTFLFDIDPEVATARRGGVHDRIEKQSLQFHRDVREAFVRQAHNAQQQGAHYEIIDASQDIETITHQIIDVVRDYIDSHARDCVDAEQGESL